MKLFLQILENLLKLILLSRFQKIVMDVSPQEGNNLIIFIIIKKVFSLYISKILVFLNNYLNIYIFLF